MSLNVTLRPAGSEDAADISEVFLVTRREALPDLPKPHTDDEVRTWIRDVVLPTTAVWVAQSDGVIVGFFSLDGHILDHLYVHPDYQRAQIGTALLDQARSLSPRHLQLYTFAKNEGARRFYELRGFHAIAFGADNEENQPDVLYEWRPSVTNEQRR
jgi:GNAT superfamily N-acetyltransferase